MKHYYALLCILTLLCHQEVWADLNVGLLAYYPFNGNANDATGNGYNGTVYDATLTNDRFGNPNSAYSFNGIDSDIEITNAFPMLGEQTVAVWVNPTSFSGYEPILEKAIPGFGGQVDFQLRCPNNPIDGTFNFVANTDNGQTGIFAAASTLVPLPTGQWSFLACVIDQVNDQVLLYTNGTLAGVGSMGGRNIRNMNYPFRIGRQIGQQLDLSFNGLLDDVRIYNRALSASEISDLYGIENNNLSAAVQSTSTVQTNLPAYPNAPQSEGPAKGLILITHGAISSFDPSEASEAVEFVNSTSNAITQYLITNGISGWQVCGLLWINQATVINPENALINAEQIGVNLGNAILSQGPNTWTNIHFIAHSAGAGIIQKATEVIKASRGTGVTIHCTFLDAFDGEIGEMAREYGTAADWSESYFVRDLFQQVGWTGRLLPFAYNVDVTALDPQRATNQVYVSSQTAEVLMNELESSHGWPPSGFYSNSIAGAIDGHSPQNYNGFGFPLSEEAGTTMELAGLEYPVGNGFLYGSVLNLGDEGGTYIPPYDTPSLYYGTVPTFSAQSTVTSTTGSLLTSPGCFLPTTGSPVWLATLITDTNMLNFVSFDAEFTSSAGAHGLLTIYWDTNMIGELDEAAVQPGLQHYNLQFGNTVPNTTHILGFHVDPFTEVHSTMVVTNIVVGCAGVYQAPILNVIVNNEALEYNLSGQNGVYLVQSSSDLLSWKNLAYLINTNGTVTFSDQDYSNYPCQFYRAVSQNAMLQ